MHGPSCATQVRLESMDFYVSARRHQLAYVIRNAQVPPVRPRLGKRSRRGSSRERIYACTRLFRERPCGVARQNVIGDTYGAQTYAGRYAYRCVSQANICRSRLAGYRRYRLIRLTSRRLCKISSQCRKGKEKIRLS